MPQAADAGALDDVRAPPRATPVRSGRALTSGLTVQDVQDWPQILQSVTSDEIIAAAQNLLRPEASVTGWMMRQEEGD